MDNRLLFKQKDFETDYARRRKNFALNTTGHPLKRGKMSKRRDVAPELLAKPNNPLAKTLSSGRPADPLSIGARPPVVPIVQPIATPPPQPPKEQTKKLVVGIQGPWAAIRGQFIKVYDTRRQRLDQFVANPFGSSGIRREQELRQRYDPKSREEEKKDDAANKQISIKTYLNILQDFRRDMKRKWEDQDKVGTLTITIQATKLLHDSGKAKFQALKFAYIIDIVQTFGQFVYDRIKKLSFPSYSDERLKEINLHQLEGSNIAEYAQEICRNWLLKIGSIRELMPRSIIQTSLLRLYFFLDGGKKVKHVLNRLAKTNRGFGEYMNSIFFSTYLVRMGHEVLPKEKSFILDILDDVFFYIKQGKTKFSRADLSYDQFFQILDPFFKSAFESLGQNLDQSDFKRFTKSLPQNPHPVIVKNLIRSFSDELLGSCCIQLAKMLQKMGQQKYPLYKMMLSRLTAIHFAESGELIIMAWGDISEINNINTFLELLAPFSEIIFRNLTTIAKNQFFSIILEKFNSLFSNFGNPKEKQFFVKFEEFLTTLIQNTENASQILTIQPFLQVISYFPKNVKIHICNKINSKFLQRQQTLIHDPVVVNTVLTLMKNLEGQPGIESIVLSFIKKVDFGNDVQAMLNFYGQIRALFGYIAVVTTDLIHKTIKLTLKARKLSKARMSKKLVAFLQACIAYCYITIPLIQNSLQRIRLYLYVSQVALALNLISQSSSLLKMTITQLTELEADGKDEEVSKLLKQIVGFLLVMPDDPENEYLFLFSGLLNAFERVKFKASLTNCYKLKFFSDCLTYLNAQVQQRLPFHIEGVNSNDFLYKTKDFRIAVLEKLQVVFGNLEQTLNLMIQQDSVESQTDKIRFASCIQSSTIVLNVMQPTERAQAYMKKLTDYLTKISQRLYRDKQTKQMLVDKKPILKFITNKLKEEQFEFNTNLIAFY